MVKEKLIGLQTEIYVGGGNFLTEAHPTNFHTFATRRLLVGSQASDDFKEVTEAERAEIEKTDAKWQRPPQSFIDEWEEKCRKFKCRRVENNFKNDDPIGCYNELTGYFELNTLTDIAYEEALRIMYMSVNEVYVNSKSASRLFESDGTWLKTKACTRCRTFFPIVNDSYFSPDTSYMFKGQAEMEVCMPFYGGYDANGPQYNNIHESMFEGCTKLRVIAPFGSTSMINFIQVNTTKENGVRNIFKGCVSLEFVNINGINTSLSFADSPKLEIDCIQYMIDHRSLNMAVNAPLTITLHPEVYAKLTDDMVSAAMEKNIAFATTA